MKDHSASSPSFRGAFSLFQWEERSRRSTMEVDDALAVDVPKATVGRPGKSMLEETTSVTHSEESPLREFSLMTCVANRFGILTNRQFAHEARKAMGNRGG